MTVQVDVDCPICGSPDMTVSLGAILAGLDEVVVTCGQCDAAYATDVVFKEGEDERRKED